jgi:anti-sigma factor ChrR (cupin superfamily)
MPDIEFIRSEIERLRHHEHTALEQTFMLEGSLEDAEGSAGAGDFVRKRG